jgi:hypothetical protein
VMRTGQNNQLWHNQAHCGQGKSIDEWSPNRPS